MTVGIISWSISTKVWELAGIELATTRSVVRHASVARRVTDCPTQLVYCQMKINIQIMRFTSCLNMGFNLTMFKMSADLFDITLEVFLPHLIIMSTLFVLTCTCYDDVMAFRSLKLTPFSYDVAQQQWPQVILNTHFVNFLSTWMDEDLFWAMVPNFNWNILSFEYKTHNTKCCIANWWGNQYRWPCKKLWKHFETFQVWAITSRL